MKPYQALIWNEWRQMRGIVLATAGAMVLLWLTLFILITVFRFKDIDTVAMLTLYLLPILCIGFKSFQGECKSQTDSFLLALPISRNRIFWCKYFFNLSIFITLTALCGLLFFPLTPYFDSAQYSTSIISCVVPVFAIMLLSVHGMSITAPLIQNSSGSKGGWAIGFSFLALLIGIQAIAALYPCNELRWVGITLFITAFIILFVTLSTGNYLWTNYVATKRNIMRPLLISAGLITAFAAILFTTAYIYSNLDLAAAKRAALTVGLKLEDNSVPPTEESRNDSAKILDALQKYQARSDAFRHGLPSQTNISFHGGYTWRSGNANPQAMRQAADFILNDSTAVKLYADLFQVLNKPNCQFTGASLMEKFPGTSLSTTEAIRNFLHDRAYALELCGKTTEAFACLDLLDKLADAVGYKRNGMGWFTLSKLKIVVNIGPDTMDGVKYYEKLLKELSSQHPEFNDDTIARLKYSDDKFKISRGPLRPLLKVGAFLLKPRYRESIANLLRWQIACKQLFERSLTTTLADVEPEMLKLRQAATILSPESTWQIQQCYVQRSQIANM